MRPLGFDEWSNGIGEAASWDWHLIELEVFHSGEDAVETNLPGSEDAEEHTESGVDVHDDQSDEPVDGVSNSWHFLF